jgi:hypothetical protein
MRVWSYSVVSFVKFEELETNLHFLLICCKVSDLHSTCDPIVNLSYEMFAESRHQWPETCSALGAISRVLISEFNIPKG